MNPDTAAVKACIFPASSCSTAGREWGSAPMVNSVIRAAISTGIIIAIFARERGGSRKARHDQLRYRGQSDLHNRVSEVQYVAVWHIIKLLYILPLGLKPNQQEAPIEFRTLMTQEIVAILPLHADGLRGGNGRC